MNGRNNILPKFSKGVKYTEKAEFGVDEKGREVINFCLELDANLLLPSQPKINGESKILTFEGLK